VESIGNGAFENCSKIKEINIPNSVESIGNEAFYGCSNLQTVNIQFTYSVRVIGYNAFKGTPWKENNKK
jgi:hypothetical protein